MALTNAERQAAYRARHIKSENATRERLNMVVALHAKRALERLASCYGLSQQATLEHVIREAERAVLNEALKLPDGPEHYYEKRIRMELKPRQDVQETCAA